MAPLLETWTKFWGWVVPEEVTGHELRVTGGN